MYLSLLKMLCSLLHLFPGDKTDLICCGDSPFNVGNRSFDVFLAPFPEVLQEFAVERVGGMTTLFNVL